MMLDNKTFDAFSKLLDHIKSVQNDIMENTKIQTMDMLDFLNENKIKPDNRMMHMLQYNDILSQQLSAINVAIDSINENIHIHTEEIADSYVKITKNFEDLNVKLNYDIEDAKRKRNAFNGRFNNTNEEEDEVEFF